MRCCTVPLVPGSEPPSHRWFPGRGQEQEGAAWVSWSPLLLPPGLFRRPCLSRSLPAVAGRTSGPAAQVTVALDGKKGKIKGPACPGGERFQLGGRGQGSEGERAEA